ncbi:hypothetical protein [Streptosporangium sandarakinum]
MHIGVMDVLVSGIGCFIAGLGIYALVTNRLPRIEILTHAPRTPRRYGWGALSLAAYAFTAALGYGLMEPGSVADNAITALSIALFAVGVWLLRFSAK